MWSELPCKCVWLAAGTCLCLLACGVPGGCARRADEHVSWRPFAPPGGGYVVLLPGTPQYVPTSEGLATWGTVVEGQMGFLTCYCQVSGVPGQSARQRLQAAASQASRQGRILQQRRVRLNGWEGLDLVVEDHEEQITLYRWYLRGRRFYQLLALVPKRRYSAEDSTLARFFESFRPTEP